jgi:hypothetical protein
MWRMPFPTSRTAPLNLADRDSLKPVGDRPALPLRSSLEKELEVEVDLMVSRGDTAFCCSGPEPDPGSGLAA